MLRSVYPRVGGASRLGCRLSSSTAIRRDGLSPRGRGSPISGGRSLGTAGSIPAWAGEPPSWTGRGPQTQVYPRVGGGADDRIEQYLHQIGLSPRGRGSLHRICDNAT